MALDYIACIICIDYHVNDNHYTYGSARNSQQSATELRRRYLNMSEPTNKQFRVLIVEDDLDLNQQVNELLSSAGYMVESVFDGDQALFAIAKADFQLVLLDVLMPVRDGFSVLRALRKTSQVPVIMVTAKNAEEERITGLRKGADDYITKPFNPTELLLRIEALLRRSYQSVQNHAHEIKIDTLRLDDQMQRAMIGEIAIDLTITQFKILWQLALHRGEVLSKAFLSQQVLNRTLGVYDRGLDMHLVRMRRKLSQMGWQGERLETVHGKGYCLK